MNGPTIDRSNARYGPVSFVVAMVHILVLDFLTWAYMPWLILVLMALPVLLIYMGIGAVVARTAGKAGQVGRGMVIGSLSAPLSVATFVPTWLIAQAIGPI
jgi:hypothetical protein